MELPARLTPTDLVDQLERGHGRLGVIRNGRALLEPWHWRELPVLQHLDQLMGVVQAQLHRRPPHPDLTGQLVRAHGRAGVLEQPRPLPPVPAGRSRPTLDRPCTRDGGPWELGIRVKDGTEDGQPLRVADGDDSWKRRGVFHLEGIASLDQPTPNTIVLDRWMAVPAVQAHPTTFTFTNQVDQRGFLSVSYPQPHIGDDGVTPVGVAYFEQYTLHWARHLPPGAWVAISFDRFWPPERDSADYIAQVEDRMLPSPRGQDGAAQAP